jgi:hypothetical protein
MQLGTADFDEGSNNANHSTQVYTLFSLHFLQNISIPNPFHNFFLSKMLKVEKQ